MQEYPPNKRYVEIWIIKINRAILILFWNTVLLITVMSETELGKLTVVSPFMPPLTSISSASVYRVSDSLTSSVSPTQCIPQENNITEIDCKWWKGISPV